jgi:putative membrane protein
MINARKPSFWQRAGWVALLWVIAVIAFIIMDLLLPGLTIEAVASAFAAVAVLALLNAFLWPLLLRWLLPYVVFSGGLLVLLFNALVIWLTGRIVSGFVVTGFWTLILTTIGVTALSSGLITLLHLDDDATFSYAVIRRLKRHSRPGQPTNVPGVLFLEIDGLAHPILLRAIRNGYMPTIAGWLESGRYRVIHWETDLSSQTSASQAGILLGSNFDVPAFRWYEKESGQIVASGSPKVAAAVERRLSSGQGLLASAGVSRGNMFSGDAPDVMCTISTVTDLQRLSPQTFYPFFANPYNFARVLVLMAREIMVEWREARRQHRRDIRPRIDRGGKYPLLRAGTNVALRELNVYTLIADMFAGAAVGYATFVGYDEVAHHAGPERPEAMKVLADLDRQFARLELAAADAPRPYRFVLLSDHGQSQGAPFRQRYGETLAELVARLVASGMMVQSAFQSSEAWEHLSAALNQGMRETQGIAGQALRHAVRGRTHDGAVVLGPERWNLQCAAAGLASQRDVVVLGSGNLGLVYFTGWRERMTLEQIDLAFPQLIPGLSCHPGISFVLVRSAALGPLAIGASGIAYLRDGRVDGRDPLAAFGPHVAEHLRYADSFPHAPDLLINSMYDAERDEIAPFEELVGAHGGLGGDQTRPFVMFPADWPIEDEPIVGAVAVHTLFKRWVNAYSREEHPAQAEPAVRAAP